MFMKMVKIVLTWNQPLFVPSMQCAAQTMCKLRHDGNYDGVHDDQDVCLPTSTTTLIKRFTTAMLMIPVNNCGSASVAVVWPNVQVPKVSGVNQNLPIFLHEIINAAGSDLHPLPSCNDIFEPSPQIYFHPHFKDICILASNILVCSLQRYLPGKLVRLGLLSTNLQKLKNMIFLSLFLDSR